MISLLILTFICAGLGGGAYYYQDTLFELVTQIAPTVISLLTQEPTITPNYTATQTFTPILPPTLPATWTPSGAEVEPAQAIPTTDPLITPTITPTPQPLQAEIIEDMDTIETQVAAIRELKEPAETNREMLSKPKLRTYMEGTVNHETDWAAEEQQQIILKALGFVSGDYNLRDVLINDRTDFFGGFFDLNENKIVIAGTGFYGLEKYSYAYEYSLALLNENYDIFNEFCQGSKDACLAESALISGDVYLTQQLWLQTYPLQFRPEDYFNLENPDPYFLGQPEPEFFAARRNFALVYGYPFISHLYDSNGWQTINYTYRYPPETSEQVIHPEKYDIRENRVLLYDPSLLNNLGEGWELVERETLGEWFTYLLLAVPDYPGCNAAGRGSSNSIRWMGRGHLSGVLKTRNQFGGNGRPLELGYVFRSG